MTPKSPPPPPQTDHQIDQGLDLPSNSRLLYIDAFSHLSWPATRPTAVLSPPPQPKTHRLPPFTTLSDLESHLVRFLGPSPLHNGHHHARSHILAIDGLDLLLASSAPDAGVTPLSLSSFLLNLRSHPLVHSTILTLSADGPLLHNLAADATPLELSHREFLTGAAYQAGRVVQLRGLDTGPARDVSGVLRISGGGATGDGEGFGRRRAAAGGRERTGNVHDKDDDDGEDEDGKSAGGEWLYQLRGDGSVRVWARGE